MLVYTILYINSHIFKHLIVKCCSRCINTFYNLLLYANNLYLTGDPTTTEMQPRRDHDTCKYNNSMKFPLLLTKTWLKPHENFPQNIQQNKKQNLRVSHALLSHCNIHVYAGVLALNSICASSFIFYLEPCF